MNFKNIFWGINSRNSWTQKQLNELKNQFNQIFLFRTLTYEENILPIGSSQIEDMIKKFIKMQAHTQEYNLISRNVMRCGLGTISVSIGFNGDLIACQEQTSRDTRDKFYIGNIYQGINTNKHFLLLQEYQIPATEECENKKECINCICREYCDITICPSVSQDKFNSFFVKAKQECFFDKILLSNTISMIKYLLDIKQNNLFSSYLEKLGKEMC